MARFEQDREDLLREATALVERAEIELLDDCPEAHAGGEPDAKGPSNETELPAGQTVVFGFRADGCASFYFGSDPAYHFNSRIQLRRAFCEGRLLKAERGRLVALERRRADGQVQLVRHELDAEETAAFLADVGRRLAALGASVAAGRYRLVGSVPADADVTGRAAAWLARQAGQIAVAERPHAM